MSVATHTFGLPLHRTVHHGASFSAIGARLWLRVIASVKARLAAAAEARAERELLAMAAHYEDSMPSFAAELRAAHARKN
ncbi:hypothetical protein RQP53_21870 [Paucibacter sp. APW11]|uniref:CopG family transcriptional regulator n=1 Tax=Roseateles aquae TaxID=3077235 RepID=A0ABU3PHP0_9BURK|nr:hypothetical protein [Paucibacter sp. APW11]MDT9001940.1 hypothetical protein [Paucibacter sp. APW11]